MEVNFLHVHAVGLQTVFIILYLSNPTWSCYLRGQVNYIFSFYSLPQMCIVSLCQILLQPSCKVQTKLLSLPAWCSFKERSLFCPNQSTWIDVTNTSNIFTLKKKKMQLLFVRAHIFVFFSSIEALGQFRVYFWKSQYSMFSCDNLSSTQLYISNCFLSST